MDLNNQLPKDYSIFIISKTGRAKGYGNYASIFGPKFYEILPKISSNRLPTHRHGAHRIFFMIPPPFKIKIMKFW